MAQQTSEPSLFCSILFGLFWFLVEFVNYRMKPSGCQEGLYCVCRSAWRTWPSKHHHLFPSMNMGCFLICLNLTPFPRSEPKPCLCDANLGCQVDTPGKRDLQLKNCLRQPGLWVCTWGIAWTAGSRWRAQSTAGEIIPRQVVPGCIRVVFFRDFHSRFLP